MAPKYFQIKYGTTVANTKQAISEAPYRTLRTELCPLITPNWHYNLFDEFVFATLTW
jgi:hypothetical protein